MDMRIVVASAPAPPPSGLLRWLQPLVDNSHITEALIAIASVSVVVWTAGFVVRTFGHPPNRGLVAGMNYAQLGFMGGLVAAFLTPLALQAVALMFLIQEIWTVTTIFFTWCRPFESRTFGQQQILDLFGLKTTSDIYWFFALQIPYALAVLCIMIWPSTLVALPLLWIALYGSYQILTSFLYVPAASTEQTPMLPQASSVLPFSEGAAKLKACQANIAAVLSNTAQDKNVFAGRELDGVEARFSIQRLTDAMTVMEQCRANLNIPTQPLHSIAHGCVYAILNHRAALSRLHYLVYGIQYQGFVAASIVDEIRAMLLYDQAALAGVQAPSTASIRIDAGVANLVIADARFGTTTRTFSVPWLGDIYLDEANTVLLSLFAYIANYVPPPVSPTESSTSTAAKIEQAGHSPSDAPLGGNPTA